ncbi:MAG: hypothetical protein KDD45_15180, partial [Bdellovibrionales bacterium]|nr:hypothetical protein [Bdellovibrionales bacterium]
MKILYLSSVRIPSEKASGLAIVRQCQAFVDIGNDLDLLIPVRDSSSKMRSIKDVYGLEPKFKVVEFSSFSMYKIGKIGFYAMLFFESLKALWYYYILKDEFDLVYSRDQRLLAPFVLFGLSEKCYLELHTKYTDLITRLIAKKVKKLIVISKGLEEYYKTFADRSHIQI